MRISDFMSEISSPEVVTPTADNPDCLKTKEDILTGEKEEKDIGGENTADTEDNDTEMQSETIKIISDHQKTKDDNLNTNHQMPSSGRDEEILVCKPNKRGLCVVHSIEMKKLSISSKKWVDRGGNKVEYYGYG